MIHILKGLGMLLGFILILIPLDYIFGKIMHFILFQEFEIKYDEEDRGLGLLLLILLFFLSILAYFIGGGKL